MEPVRVESGRAVFVAALARAVPAARTTATVEVPVVPAGTYRVQVTARTIMDGFSGDITITGSSR
ncbi:hypothetical protein ACGFXC_33345 [Streptomyces sp. NPDC048507]|uniref:hypothetical protein n=1 Tax=Streptomyces sp. NPDC048507 TaxID=3365560 RepID=UPI003710B4DB